MTLNKQQIDKHHRVFILGSGPSGWTAAIYAARANLNPAVMTGDLPGGQLTTTTDVENYPGFPDGLTGTEMMQLFQKQAERFGTAVYQGMVNELDLSQRPFLLKTESQTFSCDALIISTGASAKWLGLESEQRFQNKGVSACATCDGFFFRNQNVGVVGGGDVAMEDSLYLSNLCQSVHLFHRRDQFRASQVMQQRVLDNDNITIHWNSTVHEVLGDDTKGMTGLLIQNTQTQEIVQHDLTGLFVAIGHIPNTQPFQSQLQLDDNGYIVVEAGTTQTSVEGVFACGDVQDIVYRQAVTAAGTGCMAALDAERWLVSQT